MYAIRLDNVALGWRRETQDHILQGITGQFDQGSMTALVGPNGAGKSTLIKGLVQFIKPSQGSIQIAPGLREQMSLLPQLTDIDRSFPITVFDLVAMGAWRRLGFWRSYSRQEKQRIHEAIEQVGLGACREQLIGTLSGGQMQRALFARLIVRDAQILLLDEPFTAIDEHTQEDLMRIIQEWHQQGRTVITVLHDVSLARAAFPSALLLARQLVAWGDAQETLSEENLQSARRLVLKGF